MFYDIEMSFIMRKSIPSPKGKERLGNHPSEKLKGR